MVQELTSAAALRFLDNLNEGVIVVEAEGTIYEINKAAKRLLGLRREVFSLAEIYELVAPHEMWQHLLDAPSEADLYTAAGRVHIEANPTHWQNREFVQLVLTPAQAPEWVESNVVSPLEQLDALARVSQQLNATLRLSNVLQAIADEALRSTGTIGCQITLLLNQTEEESSTIVRGQAPAESYTTYEQKVIATRNCLIINDLPPSVNSKICSALIAPILYQGNVAGLINLYSERPEHFDSQIKLFVTVLANHAAIAIGNRERFNELEQRNVLLHSRAQQIERFVESSRVFHGDRHLAEVYEDLVYAIQEGVGFGVVSLFLVDEDDPNLGLRRITAAGLPLSQLEELQEVPHSWHKVEQLFQPQFALGGAFFVPAATETASDQWQQNDLFLIPLRDSHQQPLGLISLNAPNDGRRPDIHTAKALEIFANQAATAIENVWLFHNTRQYADRLQQLHNVSQQVLRERDFERQLQLIVESLQAAGWQRVVLTLPDKDLNPVKVVVAGLDSKQRQQLLDKMTPPAVWRERFQDESLGQYRLGSCYFIPADNGEVTEEKGLAFGAWNDRDLLFLPLYDRHRQVMAIISLEEPVNGRRPRARSLQLIELYAQLATSIIENAQLYQETQRQLAELQTVNEVGRAISTTLDLDELMQKIGHAIAAAYDVDSYYISLYRSEDETLHFPLMVDEATPLKIESIAADRGATSHVIRTGKPLLIRQLPDWQVLNFEVHGQLSRSYLGVPMRTAERIIGVLAIQDYHQEGAFDNQDIHTLSTIATQAAVAIENARLVSETLARSQELRTLFEASRAVTGTLDREVVLTAMGDHIIQAVNGDGYTVYQWNEAQKRLIVLLDRACEPGAPTLVTGKAYAPQQFDLLDEVLETQKPLVHHVNETTMGFPRPVWMAEDETYTLAILPILLRDEVFGLVQIVMARDRPDLSQNELQLLEALINQAVIALENALMFEDTYQRQRFFAALGRVSLAINATLDLPTVLNLICQESLSIFNADGAYIWQRQEDNLVGIAGQGLGSKDFKGSVVPVSDAQVFSAIVAQRGEGIFINNINATTQVNLRLPQPALIQAALGIPLKKEENIIGVLVLVEKNEPERFSIRDIEQATVFAVQAAIAIQNAQLVTELRELNEQLDERVAERTQALGEERDRVQILLRITAELSASLDQDRVLNRTLELVNEFVNATQGGILLVDAETGGLVYRAAFGRPESIPARGIPIDLKPNEGLAGWIIQHRSAVIINELREDPRWLERPDSPDHRSILAVPLIASDEVIGVLMLFHKEPNAFSEQQLELVEAAAAQVGNAINNAQLYLLIRDQAERLGMMLREEQIEAAKNEAILQSIADGVLVANANGVITLANVPASFILDIPRSQLIGKPVNELLGLYGSSGDSWVRTIEEWARHSDRIKQRSLADRLTIEDKVVSVHLSPVFASTQFFGTVSIFRDVTKEVEVDRMKNEFVSTVSHELRTPMTSIKGYADLMLMGAAGIMTEPQTRYLRVIKNNADRLSMLVNDLLDISRIETGKTVLDLRPIDVHQIIEQVVEGHLRGRIEHENKNIDVSVKAAPSLPLINADPARVTQVLTNLLDNAYHYTRENGQIRISADVNANVVSISIQDSGIGISQENQKKVFDRFFRAEDSEVQRVAGTGLGLSIVRSLVEMHGGYIEVQSALGQGSVFTVHLPLVVEDSDIM